MEISTYVKPSQTDHTEIRAHKTIKYGLNTRVEILSSNQNEVRKLINFLLKRDLYNEI